uniref:Uncharacterized protein n=1 Tax=Mycena chlorophos TaxID=658473 RepID=A0ABQ0LIT4_MYCCL|nr:predicted protein [Mycena chlorophos]
MVDRIVLGLPEVYHHSEPRPPVTATDPELEDFDADRTSVRLPDIDSAGTQLHASAVRARSESFEEQSVQDDFLVADGTCRGTLVEAIKTCPEYATLRIAHGKDFCANPPRSAPSRSSRRWWAQWAVVSGAR